MNKIFKYTFVLLLLAGIGTGCDDYLEPSVDQNRPTDTAVQSLADLESVVLGIHDDLNSTSIYGRNFVAGPEAMSDNAFSNQNSGRFIDESRHNFTTDHGYPDGLWTLFYQAIATANIAINADLESTPAVDYAKGQAYALRAFSHMQLLLAFGQQYAGGTEGIPYVTTYNEGNLYPAREPASQVWTKIGDDFTQAATLMDPALDDGNPVFMNYYAVKALQSRYYLYTGEFGNAIAAADAVINNAGMSLVAAGDLVSTWASGSGPNSLFEMGFTTTNNVGNNSIARIYRNTNYGDVEATQDLYDSFDAADGRLGLMVQPGDFFELNSDGDSLFYEGYRMVGKYVDELGSDNTRIIRYAEVLLNKAEALSRRNTGTDRATALTIINNISSTRGSGKVYTSATPADVMEERRLELAMEGHRFYDLARNGMDIPYVSVPTRGVNFITGGAIPFGNYLYALPIPQDEMDANSSMTQNNGYN